MTLTAEPLTAEAFAPFGEVIETGGPFVTINEGACRRFTDLATFDIAEGRAGLSLFQAEIRARPMTARCWNVTRWARNASFRCSPADFWSLSRQTRAGCRERPGPSLPPTTRA